MIGLLAGIVLASVNPNELPSYDPTVNLSAVRQIDCHGVEGDWMGSGYVVSKNVIFSALHVGANGVCKDHESGAKLTVYSKDVKHDFAIFTGNIPLKGPYIKYSCEPFHKDETYIAYGWSAIGYDDSAKTIKDWLDAAFLRMYTLKGTGLFTDDSFKITNEDGVKIPYPGLSRLNGRTAPGTSGGPIVDLNGYVHGGVNVGYRTFLGIPANGTYSFALHDTILCQGPKLQDTYLSYDLTLSSDGIFRRDS